ncbi:MAG: hypothetical protein AB9917_17990 [Negativicutes bacterium]
MQVRTVRTLQEVLHNILHFNGGVGSDSQIAARLALFRHWYFVPLLGMFGPEKFIGHVKQASESSFPLSVPEYMEQTEILDNFDPKPTLREWFRPATEEEHFRLRLELSYVLGKQGREPNESVYIYVLKESLYS